jgi:hypothetical protein
MTAFLVKWTGVIVLTYIVYFVCVSVGARFTVVQVGQVGISLAAILAGVMFVLSARVAAK